MAICKTCSTKILEDEVACDGICGYAFHAACLGRASGYPAGGLSTCRDCSEIKPCHVLRLMKGIAATLSTDQSFIADKVNAITANWAGLQILSDDFSSLNSKIDKLLHVTEVLNENSASLLDKTHELSSRFGYMLTSVDDLRTTLTGSDLPSLSSGHSAESIMPIIDDIRRNVRHVKGDLGSCSAAVSKNCELISSIASDIRDMTSRGALSSTVPLSASAGTAAGLDTSVPASTPLTEPHPNQRGSTSTALSRDSIPQRRSQQPEGRRLRRRKGRASPPPSIVNRGPENSHPVVAQRAAKIDIVVQQSVESEVPDNLHSVLVQPAPVIDAAVDSVELDPSTGATDAFDTVTLRPAVLPRSVFVSRIHPDTTVEDIVCHVSSRFGVSQDSVNCRRIDRSRNGAGSSFFASFKIVIPDALFHAIVSPEIWPKGTIVREFISRHNSGSRVTPKNSSARLRSTMQM